VREPPAVTRIRRKYRVVAPELDERRRRQWAAAEAREIGHGGVSVVARATGLARSTIHAGLRDLRASRRQRTQAADRIRGAGGGRRRLTTSDPALHTALLALIEPTTRGDPESPLRWTCKSTALLADELTRQHHPVSPRTVATLLKEAGYSLQGNQKTREGAAHPDRDAQFRYLAGVIAECHRDRQPAISVDTKRKELVGDFKNGGREWRPQGQPIPVRVHDFLDPALGKAIPYGVYDLANNEGWVSVGIAHDTAEFAANAIRLPINAGRLYAARYQDNRELAKWYKRLAGWLRRHFHGYRITSSTYRVGPDAWEWHRNGGLLLPMVRPVVTPSWRHLLGVAERESASMGYDV
jgi:hypothetical protein